MAGNCRKKKNKLKNIHVLLNIQKQDDKINIKCTLFPAVWSRRRTRTKPLSSALLQWHLHVIWLSFSQHDPNPKFDPEVRPLPTSTSRQQDQKPPSPPAWGARYKNSMSEPRVKMYHCSNTNYDINANFKNLLKQRSKTQSFFEYCWIEYIIQLCT